MQKPNVIFILTDDQRWDALGYAGNKIIQTPEMDKLAKNGTYFKNAFVTTPICAASRASILTGLHERTHKYTFQTGPVRQEFMEHAYPVYMKQAGYYTGFFGKLGVKYPDKDKLFDVIEDYDRNNRYSDYRGYFYKTLHGDTVHLTRYTGQKALDFIDSAPKDKPFLLSLCFSAPHAHDRAPKQYFWQKSTDYLYQAMEMPGPKLADKKYFDALPLAVREGFNRLRWTWRFETPEKYQHSVKGYYRMIKGIDDEIAKIREELKKRGLDKNTIIILMGDNGYFLGERQLAGKWLLYDNSLRVPLIVYDPRQKHRDIDEMALNIDVPATILDYAGANEPKSWQGKSLLPLVTGEKHSLDRDTILIEHLWEFKSIPPSEGVRTAGWKYFRYIDNKSIEELYDLKKDPLEINNLAHDPGYADKLQQFRKKCDQFAAKYADPYSGVPSGLMVDYIRKSESAEINDSLPVFSWIVPKEAVFQDAYQVLISSSKANINNNIGDVWDSGQVRSINSTNIELHGKSLKPNSKYFWKVRIWDQDNRLSDYSTVQEFKTGDFTGSVSTGDVFQIEHIMPKILLKTGQGSYFIDFGKDAFGTLELNYHSSKADTLTIRLGEKLNGKSIDQNPGGTIRYSEVKLGVQPGIEKYTLKLKPDVRNTLPNKAVALPDSFGVVTPFRYCEIENAKQEITENDIRQKAFYYYFDDSKSDFSSSDTTLTQIWDLCKYSMKATSFSGLYVDGDRERIPYEADAYIAQLGHYSVDREYTMARRTIKYFFESNPTWPTEWQLHVAMMMYQDYMYTGNTELIKRYYERLKAKTLMSLEVEDGFISTQSPNHNGDLMLSLGFRDTTKRLRDIVDWPPESKNFGGKAGYQKGERDGYVFKRINTVVNGFYYPNMKIMAKFATILNKPDEALDFEFRAAQVKKSINELLFNKEKGCYVDGVGTDHVSLHANMILLAFNVVPDSRKESVVKFVKSRGMACSVYGAQYLMEALYKAGEDKYALDLMTATNDRSWYNMIKVGSTITMEAWDMKYKTNADWNHAWGAAPANIIPRYMWGIKPEIPGFGLVSIHPQLANLTSSSIVIPTIRGQIKCDYKRVNGRHRNYTIELPANMAGNLVVGSSEEEGITVNGQINNPNFKSVRLQPGINRISLTINSF